MRLTADRVPRPVRRAASLAAGGIAAGARCRRWIKSAALIDRFASHGEDISFDPDGVYTFERIHLGSRVDLGYRPVLIAARSEIRIGSDVMFGPEVTIRGGNHRFDVPGMPMRSVTEDMKRPEDDLGVVIEDDVWIGTRAIILHGVRIGRGSVVGAGSVVTRSIPPFSIAAGVPARVIRPRFSPEQGTDSSGREGTPAREDRAQ